MTLPDKFWDKTRTTDCLVWTGAINSKGYACFFADGASVLAHRLAWEDVHGPIPDGLTIDHTCRVRTCVNVDHLEVVTRAENIRRGHKLNVGDECQRGHSIASEADLYIAPRGSHECRTCRAAYVASRAAAKAAA